MAHHGFPPDLIRDQHDWNRVYQALATAPPGIGTTVLRRRLLRLSCRIACHPFWGDRRSAATWAQLRRHVREHEQQDAHPDVARAA